MIEEHTMNCEINLVMRHEGKKLPEGSSRNYVGFLIKDNKREIEVDEEVVEEETAKLHSKMVIGCFIGRKPSALEFKAWLVALNTKLQGGSACFSQYQ